MFPNALLEALCRTGNLRELVDYAAQRAAQKGEHDKVTLFRAVGDQVANAYRVRG